MPRLYFCLRLVAVAVTSPAILVYMIVASAARPGLALRGEFPAFRRIWMSVGDWVYGIPVGYSYWEEYQAASMLDEIEVHHDD